MADIATDLPAPMLGEKNTPFVSNAGAGILVLPRCTNCGHLMAPPVANCTRCLSEAIEWVPSEGRGVVYSFVRYHRAWSEAFAAVLPYNVAIVQLNEGPRLISNVIEDDRPLEVGEPVVVGFQARGNDSIPVFARAPTI
jgi:uncharacterized OB-fold protein